jgi:hypothetical protein
VPLVNYAVVAPDGTSYRLKNANSGDSADTGFWISGG